MALDYRIGRWEVDRSDRTIRCEDEAVLLSPRAMDVLVELAVHEGAVVSTNHLLQLFWPRSVSSPNAVHKVITEIRHAVGAGPDGADYIETIPKRGYRVLVPVERVVTADSDPAGANGWAQHNGAPLGNGEAINPTSPPVEQGGSPVAAARAGWIVALGLTAALGLGGAFVGLQTVDVDIVELGDRSAVILPTRGDLSARDGHLGDSIRERTLQALRASGTHARTIRRAWWSGGTARDPAGWDADYAVEIELTDASDRLRGSLTIVPADVANPSRREEFNVGKAERSALTEQLASHASEDLEVLLDPKRIAQMREWGTSNVDAYRYAREGDSFQRAPALESQTRAEALYRRAVTEDPHFGYGYIQLAAVYAWIAWRAPDTAEHERQRSRLQDLLREASAAHVDPKFLDLIEHLYKYASVSNAYDAERYWHDELVKNSTDLDALIGYAGLLMGAKLVDEAQRYLERAQQQPLPFGYAEGLRGRYAGLAAARGDLEEATRVMKSYIETHPDDTLSLYSIAENLAALRRFEEAEVYVIRLEHADQRWGFSARAMVGTLSGTIPRGSEALRSLLENPLMTNALRSNVCFVLGDVECGVRYGSQMEATFLRLCWNAQPGIERYYAAGVVEDPRYQDELEALGIGRSWRAYMHQQAGALEAITGIDVTSTPPPEDMRVASVSKQATRQRPAGRGA